MKTGRTKKSNSIAAAAAVRRRLQSLPLFKTHKNFPFFFCVLKYTLFTWQFNNRIETSHELNNISLTDVLNEFIPPSRNPDMAQGNFKHILFALTKTQTPTALTPLILFVSLCRSSIE